MIKLIKPKIVQIFPTIITPSRMPVIELSPRYFSELFNLSIEWGGTPLGYPLRFALSIALNSPLAVTTRYGRFP